MLNLHISGDYQITLFFPIQLKAKERVSSSRNKHLSKHLNLKVTQKEKNFLTNPRTQKHLQLQDKLTIDSLSQKEEQQDSPTKAV